MTTNRDAQTLIGQIINAQGQALTQSETHKEVRQHSGEGDAYMVASGFVTHVNTADTYTGILWIQNDSATKNIHIGYVRGCNEVAGKWQAKRGVTALSSSATVTPVNMQFGSKKTLSATVEAANATTSVFTGGTLFTQFMQGGPGHSVFDFEGAIILQPGESFGLEFAPFSTASSNEACAFFECWEGTD